MRYWKVRWVTSILVNEPNLAQTLGFRVLWGRQMKQCIKSTINSALDETDDADGSDVTVTLVIVGEHTYDI